MAQERPSKLAIVAALPREVAALVRRLDPTVRPEPALRRNGIWLYRLPQVVVVAAGMGATRSMLAVGAALEAQLGTTELVSVGLTGGCDPRLKAGAVVEPTLAVDTRTGERIPCGRIDGAEIVLATTESIAGIREKRRLHASYGATVVDMEAATVGRLASARSLEFSMVKAVSDAFDFELEALNRFADAEGHFRTGAFALYTALRPNLWGLAATLGKNSSRALQALTDRLVQRIEAGR